MMEKHIKALFNDSILRKAATFYSIPFEDLEFVGGFENFIYGFKKESEEFIMRISHASHRTVQEVESELDFVNFLAHYDANVSVPVFSIHQKLVEQVFCSDGSYFTISVYTKALGERPKRSMMTPELFESYGKTIGSFHWLSKMYMPAIGIHQRFTWDEDPLLVHADAYLKEEDSIILERFHALVDEIKMMKKSKNNYGLIHTDIHAGNFFIKDNELTVFDFDDCSYMWFVSDIAIALFYHIDFQKITQEEKIEQAKLFMKHFMIGYSKENKLSKKDFLAIEKFLKLRELVLYIVFHRSMDVEKDGFAQSYIKRHRDSIINQEPFLPINYTSFI
jgi:amicoumacin kinase